MLSLFDRRPGYSRREFLRIGTLGLGGLSLPHLLGARALAAGNKPITTGKSVIFLYLFGGPSQFETFDPKMSAPDGIRSVTGEIATALPGVTFGSSFPQLAKRAKQLAVVRSYVPGREISNHVIYPIVHRKETLGASLGSLYSRMAGMTDPANGMPTNAALFPQSVDASCKPVRCDFGNFLATGPVSSAFAPFVPGGGSTLQQNMRLNMDRDRLEDRRQLLAQFDGIKRQLDTSGTLDAHGSHPVPGVRRHPPRRGRRLRPVAGVAQDHRPLRHGGAGAARGHQQEVFEAASTTSTTARPWANCSCWPGGCAKAAAAS